MASPLNLSVPVVGPDGTRVRVLFYEDGSIRFRISKTPLVIEEAYLQGTVSQGHSIIKLAPAPERSASS